jgi:enterochelin esterase-like enzyme
MKTLFQAIRPLVLASGVLLGPVGCGGAVVERFSYGLYPSPAMQRDMTYSVYTPPDWTATERLPLVVLLHGALDDPKTPNEYGVGQVLDEQLARGDIPRVVIVTPQGDMGFWENWVSGERRYRDWVMLELLPHIQRRYHTRDCPAGCHVMGVSMGGEGALSFAMAAPTQWASVSLISAPVFNIDEVRELYDSFLVNLFVPLEDIWGPFIPAEAPARNVYTRWQGPSDVGPFKLLVTWGARDSDEIRETSRRFAAHLEAHHIAARSFEFDGEHSWKNWRDVFPVVLRDQVQD